MDSTEAFAILCGKYKCIIRTKFSDEFNEWLGNKIFYRDQNTFLFEGLKVADENFGCKLVNDFCEYKISRATIKYYKDYRSEIDKRQAAGNIQGITISETLKMKDDLYAGISEIFKYHNHISNDELAKKEFHLLADATFKEWNAVRYD